MKIIYIFDAINIMGGTERMFVAQMNYLAEHFDYNVTLITYEQALAPDAFELSNKVKHIDLNICFYKQYKVSIFKRFIFLRNKEKEFNRKMCDCVNEIKPDIVVCSSYFSRELKFLSKLKSTKRIIQSHTSFGNFSKRNGLKKYKYNILKQIYYNYDFLKSVFYIKKCDCLVVLTRRDAQTWKFFKKTKIIGNPIIGRTKTMKDEKIKKSVISVGRLAYEKGFDKLILAWNLVHKKHSDWKLDIYGEGVEHQNLQKQIDQLKLSDVITLQGAKRDIHHYYNQSDFYVLTSRREGFPLVLIEAMSHGLPCISFDCQTGPNEIISNGHNGYLVENGNVTKMAEKISYMIEHHNECLEMGRNALVDSSKYDMNEIMKQWKSLYESFL